MTFYESVIQFFSQSKWIYHVFFVVFTTLFLDLAWRRGLRVLHRKVEKRKNRWDDAFFHSARLPTSILIWLTGICYAIQFAPQVKVSGFLYFIEQGQNLATIGLIAWFLVKFIQSVEVLVLREPSAQTQNFDQTSLHAISKLLRISVIITAVLIALEALGYSLKGVLAFGGIGGIAVGFAAKDLLANFFGGLMIFLDRPFALGDWVRSPDRNIEGTVEHIGWRLTRIRTFDQRPLYIPNSVFTNIAVENPSRMTNRRIFETIGLRYDDVQQLEVILAAVETMLRAHPAIDISRTLIVNFNAYGTSALEFFIYAFTKTTHWVEFHKIKQDILLKVHDIITEHHAEIAYPTQRLVGSISQTYDLSQS